MLTERAARGVGVLLTNLGAALGGAAGAWAVGFGWWSILVAPLTGTAGWLLGWFAGRRAARALASGGYAPPGLPVYRLRSLPPDETTAGGKARSLSRLIRAGHRVPEGLVILPRGFDGEEPTPDASAALRTALRRFPDGQRFAVRSSALSEDSAAASFAGAYESELDVAGGDLSAAIARVRASAGSERVAAYAEGVQVASGGLAVVVQAMVPADLAGVLFTVHPLTRALDTMLGTVVTGLGEGLVSGERTGDQFTLHRPDGGYEGPEALAPTAARLHDEAHRIEGAFGGVPQDIEWAVASGRLWILQSRPVSTLNPWQERTAERNDSLAGTCLWSATNLSEANPEAQTPLTLSFTPYLQAHGGPSMALRGREMAGSIGGRPYANLSVQVTGRRGKAATLDPREAYRAMAGWWGDLPDGVPLPLIPMTRADWTDAGLPLLGTLATMAIKRRRLPEFVRRNPGACAELTAAIEACATPAELLTLWERRLLGHGLESFWAVIAGGSEYPARLEGELRDELGAHEKAALMSNLSGLAGDLESLGPAAGLQQVRDGVLSREEYLARYGHRGVNETELAWPRPAEDPGWLDRELAVATGGADVAVLRARQQAAFDAMLTRIADADPARARTLRARLARAARDAARRETARSEGIRSTGVQRRFALRAGELLGIGEDVFWLTIEELLAALRGDTTPYGWFAERRASYERHRALPPLPGLILGAFDPFAWASDPNRRADLAMAGVEVAASLAPARDGVVTGHPGALGRVEGLVRRLDSFDQAAALQPGEVLVTSLTNIGWTPLFPRAGAIVTDLGAPLSHAAIVAREWGIPAVVGCGDATSRLRTGDLVVVDGAAGTVEVLAARVSGTAESSG